MQAPDPSTEPGPSSRPWVAQGRKTGKFYETPISYLHDGDQILSISNREILCNWYRNVLASGEAVLNIRGEQIPVIVEPIESPAEIDQVFWKFHREFGGFERAFRVAPDAPDELLLKAKDRIVYIRMTPKTLARGVGERAPDSTSVSL